MLLLLTATTLSLLGSAAAGPTTIEVVAGKPLHTVRCCLHQR